MTATEPLDATHSDSAAAVAAIRRQVAQLRARDELWNPAPMPPGWVPDQRGKARP